MPLHSGTELLGYLYADDVSTDPPPEPTLQLARSLAAELALTLTRERLRAALAREEARYRQLAEGAHDLILTADVRGRITYANPAARRLLGGLPGPGAGETAPPNLSGGADAQGAPSLLGRSLPGLLAGGEGESSLAAFSAAWEAAKRQPEGGRAEVRAGPYHLEVRLSPVPGENGVLVVARDLSILKRQAAEIEQRGAALQVAQHRHLELRSFLALFTQAQEEERRRISRELHDDTAQVLSASGRRAARLARSLPPAQSAEALQLRDDLNAALLSVRRFARNLRPSVLDDLGLLPALEWLTTQIQTPARLEISGTERRLSPALELTVFRLVQEALSNVDRHSGASSAAVRVRFGDGEVEVRIADDGQGFSPQQAQARAEAGHLGLTSLRERAELAGGRLEIRSAAGQGTALEFWLPSC
ncbi:ATP-binding protein [Deinococcus lacus]|uniref:Oxygen sensor histidine kinase NreB n=1 Tax=Deinococcus lacus TaxID=392561 RepID=A0ABW1YDV6_9DEIO